jgi:hypothetical protein
MAIVLIALGPSTSDASADPVDVNTIPGNLRQYIVDTPRWVTSPWMTSAGCQGHGGDFSVYAANVIHDSADLIAFFQPELVTAPDPNGKARGQATLQTYRDTAAAVSVPTGYCVDTVRTWAQADPTFKPFAFQWGDYPQQAADSGRHHLWQDCTNALGADNAPCGGFYVGCDGAVTQQQHQQCQAWNDFSDDFVQRIQRGRNAAIDKYPGIVQGVPVTKLKSPSEIAQDIMDWTVKTGMAQVVSFVVDGVTKLWALFRTIIVDGVSPNLAGQSFAAIYNLVAGIALALAFLGWLVTLGTAWKQGRLQYALVGGLKAAVGATLAGVGAILMQQLATDCTHSLLSAAGNLGQHADFTQSLAKTNPLVALLVGVVMAICLIFALIFMVLDGALTLMWALLGGIAAAGQVHPASAGWLIRWAGRGTALAWAPFVMVAEMLLGQALMLPMDAGEDVVKQGVDVVQGLVLVIVLVASPMVLWELVEFVSDRPGGAAALGAGATGRAGAGAAGAARAGREGATKAVGAMKSGASQVAQRLAGRGSNGKGSGSTGSTRPPRAEAAGPAGWRGGRGNGESGASSPSAGTDKGGDGSQPEAQTGSRPRGSAAGGWPLPAANRGRVVAGGWTRPQPPEPGPGGQVSGWEQPPGEGRGGSGGGSGSGPPRVPPPV